MSWTNAILLILKNRYSAGKNVINDLECQTKVICEIYRDETNELGELGKRAKHSLDFVDAVQYLNLPDEFVNLADEYMVRNLFSLFKIQKPQKHIFDNDIKL